MGIEVFLKYLSDTYFVKYDVSELQDMIITIQQCMEDFVNSFNKNETCALKIDEILLCGSMSEHTSIWLGSHNLRIWTTEKTIINKMDIPEDFRCLELDYLAILKPLTADMRTTPTCPGHARIGRSISVGPLLINQLRNVQSKCDHEPFECDCMEDIYEKPFQTVREEFHAGIIKTAKNVILQRETIYGRCCLHFIDTYRPSKVLFVWTSKNPSGALSNVVGKIDFLPAFITTHLQEPTYLVGIPCIDQNFAGICATNVTCESNCKEQCWRISHNTKEASCIRNTASYHRDSYRIIKIFSDVVLRHQYLSTSLFDHVDMDFAYSFKVPTSYHSKTILLRHIATCVAGDFDKCLKNIISDLKMATEKGSIQTWEQTHSLAVEYFEIYFFCVLEFILTREKEGINSKLNECPMPLLTKVLNNILSVKSMIADTQMDLKNTERCLINVLVYPLWDYALETFKLNKDIFEYDKCDIELEKRAKIYKCHSQEQESSLYESSLIKCHSESHIDILVDFFSDKNFNKNWEYIFWNLKINGRPFTSLTRKIILERVESVFNFSEDENILPYEYSMKQMIKGIVLEEKDYWHRKLLETFVHFSVTLDLATTFSDTD